MGSYNYFAGYLEPSNINDIRSDEVGPLNWVKKESKRIQEGPDNLATLQLADIIQKFPHLCPLLKLL